MKKPKFQVADALSILQSEDRAFSNAEGSERLGCGICTWCALTQAARRDHFPIVPGCAGNWLIIKWDSSAKVQYMLDARKWSTKVQLSMIGINRDMEEIQANVPRKLLKEYQRELFDRDGRPA